MFVFRWCHLFEANFVLFLTLNLKSQVCTPLWINICHCCQTTNFRIDSFFVKCTLQQLILFIWHLHSTITFCKSKRKYFSSKSFLIQKRTNEDEDIGSYLELRVEITFFLNYGLLWNWFDRFSELDISFFWQIII